MSVTSRFRLECLQSRVADSRTVEASTGPEQDRNSLRVISDVIDYDPPELVVLNGDLINGDSTWPENSTAYLDIIVAPLIERNLTWASTYGNHDHSHASNTEEIYAREQTLPGSRTKKMVNTTDSGTSNYYLPVYAANCTDTTECAPELIMWFFDSRGGSMVEADDQHNWVDISVVEWFNETSTSLVTKHKKVIPSIAFVHIPINAAVKAPSELGLNANYQPGMNNEEPIDDLAQAAGFCPDGTQDTTNCPYGGQDEAFMQALVSTDGIMGLFFGHDHGNSYCYRWDTKLAGMDITGNGIALCYGQHSGYGGYSDWTRGGRQIVVKQDELKDYVVNTHIRLETGKVVGAVSLNSTFGKDFYPATLNTKTYMSDYSSSGATSDSSRPEPSNAPAALLVGLLALFSLL